MASVNNGVFICINCAAIHSGFDQQEGTSIIKSMTLDPWSELETWYLSMGGNLRLTQYFEEYGLMEEDAQTRLRTEAAAFYRRRLEAQVTNNEAFDEK